MATTVRLQNMLMATSLGDKSFTTFEDLAIWAFLQEVADQLTNTDSDLKAGYNAKDHTLDVVKGNVGVAASLMYSNTKKRVTFWVSGYIGDEDVVAASMEYMADYFTPRKAADFIRKQMAR